MQQADRAASTRTGDASPGKFDDISTRSIVLVVAEINGSMPLIDQSALHLARIKTLLLSITESVLEAADPQGFWFREKGWERRRFDHLADMIDLVGDEVGRLDRLMTAGEGA